MMQQQMPDPTQKGEEYLAMDRCIPRYVELCAGLKDSFLKLERLQSYQEPSNTSYCAYRDGDKSRAQELLWENVAAEAGDFTKFARDNVQQVRVRLVELPLSDYLKWEFDVYRLVAQFGQRILVTDITNDSKTSLLSRASDCIIFDRKVALRNHYDEQGVMRGAWLTEDPQIVSQYLQTFQEARQRSVPLAVFQHEQGLV